MSVAPGEDPRSFVLIAPCLDDWDSVRALLPLVDAAVAPLGVHLDVLIVDDGSRDAAPDDLVPTPFRAIRRVQVLSLLRNVGHQRALCIGLCHVATDRELQGARGVIVMDADGEDAPTDVARLITSFEEQRGERAVFASRMRRSEGVLFRSFYFLYRGAHRLLTGIPVRIGNFSVLPMSFVRRLSVVSELWSHYAAAVVQSRLPMELLPTARAQRLSGRSRMNFVALVSHGLGAMSVFADRIGVRALIVSLGLTSVLVAGLLGVVAIRVFTTLAIPGWATSAAGILAVLVTQSLLLALFFAFIIHLGRAGGSFLPARDYSWFVDRVHLVWSSARGL